MPFNMLKPFLPPGLFSEVSSLKSVFKEAEELRIRAKRPSMLYAAGKEYILSYTPDKQELQDIIFALSKHSLYSFSEEIKEGFFTVDGGLRIGIAGKVVHSNGEVLLMRDYTSVNIRFPHEFKGISKKVINYIKKNGKLLNTLIVSAPNQGKTTLLRDIIREAGGGGGSLAPSKCAVIDERSEISASGIFDLSERTDVLLGCPKSKGMEMALRALSPEIIATDEIGNADDLRAIYEAVNSGVKVIATAHGADINELLRRLFFRELLGAGIMERIILLSERFGKCTVENIFDEELRGLLNEPIILNVYPEENRCLNTYALR